MIDLKKKLKNSAQNFPLQVKLYIGTKCRNMSGHALMGRPAARLVTMVLVIRSYVLVYIVGKRR